MRQKIKKIEKREGQRHLTMAVIVADFNERVTSGLLRGALQAIRDIGVDEKNIKIYHVAGSFEVAELAMRLAKSKRFKALVCLGAIIKGETAHDQHLTNAVTNGLLRVALDTGVPVGLGVITANNLRQAMARAAANEYNRGYATAAAVISLAFQKI